MLSNHLLKCISLHEAFPLIKGTVCLCGTHAIVQYFIASEIITIHTFTRIYEAQKQIMMELIDAWSSMELKSRC